MGLGCGVRAWDAGFHALGSQGNMHLWAYRIPGSTKALGILVCVSTALPGMGAVAGHRAGLSPPCPKMFFAQRFLNFVFHCAHIVLMRHRVRGYPFFSGYFPLFVALHPVQTPPALDARGGGMYFV